MAQQKTPSRYTVKPASDAACAWGASERKRKQRIEQWCATLQQARGNGALPEQLWEAIEEGANAAGCPAAEVPVEVYRAAGLDVPSGG